MSDKYILFRGKYKIWQIHKDKVSDRQIDLQTDRQIGKQQTDIQIERWTEDVRQTDTYMIDRQVDNRQIDR